MTDTVDRLKAALADRYVIEHELGSGGMATSPSEIRGAICSRLEKKPRNSQLPT